MKRRTAVANGVGDRVINLRVSLSDAMMPGRGRCGEGGTENNRNGKRNFCLAHHFKSPVELATRPEIGWRYRLEPATRCNTPARVRLVAEPSGVIPRCHNERHEAVDFGHSSLASPRRQCGDRGGCRQAETTTTTFQLSGQTDRQWSARFLSLRCRRRATYGVWPFFLTHSIASRCVLNVASTWSA